MSRFAKKLVIVVTGRHPWYRSSSLALVVILSVAKDLNPWFDEEFVRSFATLRMTYRLVTMSKFWLAKMFMQRQIPLITT